MSNGHNKDLWDKKSDMTIEELMGILRATIRSYEEEAERRHKENVAWELKKINDVPYERLISRLWQFRDNGENSTAYNDTIVEIRGRLRMHDIMVRREWGKLND